MRLPTIGTRERHVPERGSAMQLTPARPSKDIKVITAAVLIVFAGVFIFSFYNPLVFLATTFIGVTIIVCYIYTPTAYDVSRDDLTIVFRKGKKKCGRIHRAALLNRRMPMTLRVWGNGGLFAGSGLFWNRKDGFFRAYVTSSKRPHLVLVEADIGKVIVSPEHPGQFFQAAGFPLSEAP